MPHSRQLPSSTSRFSNHFSRFAQAKFAPRKPYLFLSLASYAFVVSAVDAGSDAGLDAGSSKSSSSTRSSYRAIRSVEISVVVVIARTIANISSALPLVNVMRRTRVRFEDGGRWRLGRRDSSDASWWWLHRVRHGRRGPWCLSSIGTLSSSFGGGMLGTIIHCVKPSRQHRYEVIWCIVRAVDLNQLSLIKEGGKRQP